METRALEQLFDRFRRAGDVQALAQVFDRTAPELALLARHLARASEADDLVQETFLAAIERAWSWDERAPLVPWLVGILTIAARRRRVAREPDPARVHEPASVAPEREAASHEAGDLVSAALASVPEKYRRVLELHLEHGQPPAEIARALASAPGTVRVQLHRGLELLRKALPAGLALGAAAPLIDSRALAAVRERVLASAGERAAPLAQQGVELARVLARRARNGLIAKALGVGALVAVGGFAAVRALRAPTSPLVTRAGIVAGIPAPAPGVQPTGVDTSRAAMGEPELARADEAQRVALAAAAAPDGGVLHLRLKGLDPALAEPLTLSVRVPDDAVAPWSESRAAAQELDVAIGRFLPPNAYAQSLFARVDHPCYLPVQVAVPVPGAASFDEIPRELAAELQLVRAVGAVRGRVLLVDAGDAAADEPLPAGGRGDEVAEPAVRTVLIQRPAIPGVRGAVEGVADAEAIDRLRLAPHARAAPPASERTWVGLFRLRADGTPERAAVEYVAVAGDGRFRLRSNFAGEHALAVVSPGARPATRSVIVRPGEDGELEPIALEAGLSAAGFVETPDGAPVPGAHVQCAPVGTGHAELAGTSLTWSDGAFELAPRAVDADAQGAFRLEHLGPCKYRLSPWPRSAPVPKSERLAEKSLDVRDLGRDTEIVAPVEGVRLRLGAARALLEVSGDGHALAGAMVDQLRDGAVAGGSATDAAGLLELDVCAVEPFDLRVALAGFASRDLHVDPATLAAGARLRVDLGSGGGGARLRIDAQGAGEFPLCVNVTDLAGLGDDARARIAQGVYLDREPMVMKRALPADGSIARELAPGRYAIEVAPFEEFHAEDLRGEPGDFRLPARFELDVAGPGLVVAPARIERGGRLRLQTASYAGSQARAKCVVRNATGAPVRVRFARALIGSDGKAGIAATSDLDLSERSLSTVLPAGAYELELSGEHIRTLRLPVTVVAERATDVRLELAEP